MKRITLSNKRSPEREQVILTALEWGASWINAAKLAGVTAETVKYWRKNYPDFEEATLAAKAMLRTKQRRAAFRSETPAARHIPYGWRLVDGEHFKDPEEQKVLALIIELKGLGLYLPEICSELESRGILNRNGRAIWSKSKVSNIIHEERKRRSNERG
jgi:hypothetical protein